VGGEAFSLFFFGVQETCGKNFPWKRAARNRWLPFRSQFNQFVEFFHANIHKQGTLSVYMRFPYENFCCESGCRFHGQSTAPQQLQVVANNGYKMLRQENGLEVFQGQ